MLDIIAADAKELADYQKTFDAFHQAAKDLQALKEEIERNRQNIDFLQFQYQELESANLTVGEQEELEQKSETMTHAEDIKGALYTADNALQADNTGIVEQLRNALNALKGIGHVFPEADELATRVDSTYIELKDIAQEVGSLMETIDFDPAELDHINERLDRLYDLQQKYHAEDTEALIALRDQLKEQLAHIGNSDETLQERQQQVNLLKAQCQQKADQLTKLRTKAAKMVETEMQQRLVPLGMPHIRFQISIHQEDLSGNGQDKVAYLFSANTSTPLQPVSQVASGGEIARVMLALKAMISGAVKLPTIIFDEIDTGVSGKIAEKMAEIMYEMGSHERQVISITHLPQIAALGSAHYKVEKEETPQGTTSKMELLTADERITEIAQMLSGSKVTEAAIQNAKQLLRFAK